ncbi:hypothetical protein ORN12_11195 [Pantoea vagans]|uniref:hypothetical protein n=1 Tax=Pantoea vagans TaxID=470934 RepID=UPI00225AD2D9|nr:hypothetical protein [Pantoea vagans]MCX3309558.1 hypothetical protein [Pantoea vagans]
MNTLAIFARRHNKIFYWPDLITVRKTPSEMRKPTFSTATLKIKNPYKTEACEEVIAKVNINASDTKTYKIAYRKTDILIQTRTIPDKTDKNIKECFSRGAN